MNTGGEKRAHRRAPLHGMALAAFALYAFILLHPLWVYNGTHAAGYDYFNYNWNFWWIRYAWANGLDIYQNNFVMFPALSNYGYHALTAFWYPVWALLEPLTGTLTAVNVIITLACILNGYLFFVWLRAEGVAPGLALLGGVILQTLPITRYWYYNTHLNLMDWFWLPGLLLLWKRIVQLAGGRRLRDALILSVLFGVALWGLLLTDLQFPIFALFIVGPYGVLTLLRPQSAGGTERMRLVLIACGVLAVAVGAALMWFAGPLPHIARFEGTLTPGPVEDRPGILFPLGFLSMAERWWSWDQPSLGAFFPLLLFGMALAAFIRWRRWVPWMAWFWLAAAVPPLVLAMGPYLTVGETRVPLPYILMYDLTNGNFRMPWRLAPAGAIAGMTFVGLVLTPHLYRASRTRLNLVRPLAALTAALLLSGAAVRLFETAPLDPVLPPYEGYAAMGREPYEYVVLQAPTGMGTGEVLLGSMRAIQYQWYGMAHEKRMVNGFISRAPIEQFYYVDTGDPLLSWLGQRIPLDPPAAEVRLRERVFSDPIGYIVLHTDDIARASGTATEEIIGFFNGLDDVMCPPEVEGAALFFRTRWHPDGCSLRTPLETESGVYTVDIGAPEDVRYLGWGWHYAEPVAGIDWRWMGAPSPDGEAAAQVYFDLPPGNYRLTLTGQAFEEPRTLAVSINGTALDEALTFTPDVLGEASLMLPASLIGDGQHVEVRLAYDATRTAGQGDQARPLAVAVDQIRLERVDG